MADGGGPAAAARDVLLVDGMFCAACAASVEAALGRIDGVRDASVSFAADAAVVEWSGAPDTEALIDRVRELGYTARRPSEVAADDDGTRASRGLAVRLAVAVFFGMWVMLPSIALYLDAAAQDTALVLAAFAGIAALPVVTWCGLPFYRMGIATLRHGVAGVDALVTLGVAGALALSAVNLARGSADVYFEVAVALITLQLVARWFDARTRGRAREAVGSLLRLAPSRLRLRGADGQWRDATASEAHPGDRAMLVPGQRAPVDALVLSGRAHVDGSLTSGESDPRVRAAGDAVIAGELVLDGSLEVEVTAKPGSRRIDALAAQVRQLLGRKPAWQRGVDRLARHFLVIASVLAAAGGALASYQGADVTAAATRALAVFVIACPCALSLAAPIAGVFAAAAGARRGIVLRDLNAITHAAAPDRLFVDKTGTLTRGQLAVAAVHPHDGIDEHELLDVAAAAEAGSEHPIARAILTAAASPGPVDAGHSVVPGHGVRAQIDGHDVVVGAPGWLAAEGVDVPTLPGTESTRVGVARDGRWLGAIDLSDTLRPDARAALDAVDAAAWRTTILSGDRAEAVRAVAESLGIEYQAGMTPEDKVQRIERARAGGRVVAFVGDGLNDGPALAAADLGIAVGDATDAARAAAAATFVGRGIEALPELLDITRRARAVIRQNLVWAVVYNAIAIPAALFGYVHPAVAAVAMALSSLTVVANAARLLEK